jgi:hypothetical protein
MLRRWRIQTNGGDSLVFTRVDGDRFERPFPETRIRDCDFVLTSREPFKPKSTASPSPSAAHHHTSVVAQHHLGLLEGSLLKVQNRSAQDGRRRLLDQRSADSDRHRKEEGNVS